MNVITYYRIFEDKDGIPCTLFHGVNGSRKLPLDEWIESNNKEVTDGSCSKSYLSGFHLLDSVESVIKFLNKFRDLTNRVICAVDVDLDAGVWKKEHSSPNIKLVKRIRINKEYWDNRILAKDFK